MTEYRTKPLNRQLLLDEVAFVSCKLKHGGSTEVAVSFGWDSNLPIDEMWKEVSVPVEEVQEYIRRAEQAGIVVVGKGDIFVESQDFCLTLCHEGDAHVGGIADLIPELVDRWKQLDYQPYEVKQQS